MNKGSDALIRHGTAEEKILYTDIENTTNETLPSIIFIPSSLQLNGDKNESTFTFYNMQHYCKSQILFGLPKCRLLGSP